MAALGTIAKIKKQLKYMRTDERIQEMGYIYPVQYYSDIYKDEKMPFALTGKKPEMIILSEVNETGKDRYHRISLLVKSKNGYK